ncbi:hypothetical protein BU14_0368s0017, partial [Porphyra umbilicalis]
MPKAYTSAGGPTASPRSASGAVHGSAPSAVRQRRSAGARAAGVLAPHPPPARAPPKPPASLAVTPPDVTVPQPTLPSLPTRERLDSTDSVDVPASPSSSTGAAPRRRAATRGDGVPPVCPPPARRQRPRRCRRHEDVGRPHVIVDDPLPVRIGERRGHARRHLQRNGRVTRQRRHVERRRPFHELKDERAAGAAERRRRRQHRRRQPPHRQRRRRRRRDGRVPDDNAEKHHNIGAPQPPVGGGFRPKGRLGGRRLAARRGARRRGRGRTADRRRGRAHGRRRRRAAAAAVTAMAAEARVPGGRLEPPLDGHAFSTPESAGPRDAPPRRRGPVQPHLGARDEEARRQRGRRHRRRVARRRGGGARRRTPDDGHAPQVEGEHIVILPILVVVVVLLHPPVASGGAPPAAAAAAATAPIVRARRRRRARHGAERRRQAVVGARPHAAEGGGGGGFGGAPLGGGAQRRHVGAGERQQRLTRRWRARSRVVNGSADDVGAAPPPPPPPPDPLLPLAPLPLLMPLAPLPLPLPLPPPPPPLPPLRRSSPPLRVRPDRREDVSDADRRGSDAFDTGEGGGDAALPGAGDAALPSAGDAALPSAGDAALPSAGDADLPGAGDAARRDSGYEKLALRRSKLDPERDGGGDGVEFTRAARGGGGGEVETRRRAGDEERGSVPAMATALQRCPPRPTGRRSTRGHTRMHGHSRTMRPADVGRRGVGGGEGSARHGAAPPPTCHRPHAEPSDAWLVWGWKRRPPPPPFPNLAVHGRTATLHVSPGAIPRRDRDRSPPPLTVGGSVVDTLHTRSRRPRNSGPPAAPVTDSKAGPRRPRWRLHPPRKGPAATDGGTPPAGSQPAETHTRRRVPDPSGARVPPRSARPPGPPAERRRAGRPGGAIRGRFMDSPGSQDLWLLGETLPCFKNAAFLTTRLVLENEFLAHRGVLDGWHFLGGSYKRHCKAIAASWQIKKNLAAVLERAGLLFHTVHVQKIAILISPPPTPRTEQTSPVEHKIHKRKKETATRNNRAKGNRYATFPPTSCTPEEVNSQTQ